MSNLECIGLKEIENLTATEFKLKCFCVKILNINEENKMSSITVSDQSGTCKISCRSKFANIIKLLIPGKSYKIFGLEQDPDPRHDLKVVNNSYFSILKETDTNISNLQDQIKIQINSLIPPKYKPNDMVHETILAKVMSVEEPRTTTQRGFLVQDCQIANKDAQVTLTLWRRYVNTLHKDDVIELSGFQLKNYPSFV